MADHPTPADTTHAMRTLTRYQQQDVTEPRGRFGRLVAHDVEMADARTTMETDRAGERLQTAKYEIDPDAVADAIVARLLAGRTRPLRRDGER